MYRCPRGLVVLAVSAGLLLMASATRVPAQAVKDQAKKEPLPPVGKLPAPKQVDILTVDKVELKAKFYPSTKGKEAACVLLLHALGDSSDNKEWTNFAKKLQEKGYAVLMFDFRGHGDSTTVEPGVPAAKGALGQPGFWDQKENRAIDMAKWEASGGSWSAAGLLPKPPEDNVRPCRVI